MYEISVILQDAEEHRQGTEAVQANAISIIITRALKELKAMKAYFDLTPSKPARMIPAKAMMKAVLSRNSMIAAVLLKGI